MKLLRFILIIIATGLLCGNNKMGPHEMLGKSHADSSLLFKYPLAHTKGGEKKPTLSLGVMYFISRGVTQDNTEAATWFRKAAKLG